MAVEGGLEGNSLSKQHNVKIDQRIAILYEGLKEPAPQRHGESRDKTEELVHGAFLRSENETPQTVRSGNLEKLRTISIPARPVRGRCRDRAGTVRW